MSTFFGLLLNVAVVLAALAQYYLMGLLAIEPNSLTERYIRVLAFATGILVVLGAKAIGTSISFVLVRALLSGKPVSVGLLGVAIPAAAGAAIAWYFVRTIRKKSSNIAMRVLIFIGVLSVTEFSDVYIAALRKNGVDLDATLAPNISFIVGICLYLILTWDPENPAEAGLVNTIKKVRRRGEGEDDNPYID
ncbi:hypothetical protein [Streptomyces canus]|uniref:hypothetical protein n=1 Tax=Streptomyces canus TaxID=58343 RepID=UPI002785DD7D|nr:hypothetical protein [Streptomyces canus]MDQ1068350.1 hypothetical protein [Streptomyces canus]